MKSSEAKIHDRPRKAWERERSGNYELRIGLLLTILLIMISGCKDDGPVPDYPTDGLISYLPFDGNLNDMQGHLPNPAINGGTTFDDGKRGRALTLNGLDQSIWWESVSFASGDSISVSIWFKTPVIASYGIFTHCLDFYIGTTYPIVHFQVDIPPAGSASGNFVQNAWIHLVGTYDGENMKIYINELLAETTPRPGGLLNGSSWFIIGQYQFTKWAGSIDELFIYDRALSQNEVSQLFNR
ncbi:MAG: LamG domain-containing protein [Bacteroidetes bacterium]|nr:LamG domain-containing protein [Bacteroidota bacterium]